MGVQRHNLISYSLEKTPRPGAHEIRVRPAPDGMRIRNGRNNAHAE